MASQQPAKRVTRGTVKRHTLGGDAQAPARGQTPLDAPIHLPPTNATPPMDFGTDGDSDEECASALEVEHVDGMDRQPPTRHQPDTSQMEYSDDGDAPIDDSQRHLVQTAADRRPMPVPSEEQSAGTETEYESAMSDGEDDITVVDVATRETVQQPSATGPQQNTRSLMPPPPETSVAGRIRARQAMTASIARPEANVLGETVQTADGNGSPQPPISARRTNPEPQQPLLPPNDENRPSRDPDRRSRGRLTVISNAPIPTPAQHQLASDTAAGDRVLKNKHRSHEVLLPLEVPDENDPYVNQYAIPDDKYEHSRPRESGLRMPLFDGVDWAGFISQFEACSAYYGWKEKTKAIRLYTSIVGDARKSLGTARAANWPFDRLKRHMEVRFGKNKVFATIQEELFARQRRANQSLYAFHDEIVAAANTANITDEQRTQLVYTAFVYGLRSNKHMHRWVSRRDTVGTIESALELAEAYEDEYGGESVLQSLPVTVNARDSTGNPLAVALPAASDTKTVSVNAVQLGQGDKSLAVQMANGFQQMEAQITKQFATIDTRLGAVEKFQTEQTRRWEERRNRNQTRRDNKRAQNYQSRNNTNDRDQSEHKNSKFYKKQGSKTSGPEVNVRDSQPADQAAAEE